MVFILVLFAHVGPMGSGNSNALTTVNTPFLTKQACVEAGKLAQNMASGTTKVIEYACLEIK